MPVAMPTPSEHSIPRVPPFIEAAKGGQHVGDNEARPSTARKLSVRQGVRGSRHCDLGDGGGGGEMKLGEAGELILPPLARCTEDASREREVGIELSRADH